MRGLLIASPDITATDASPAPETWDPTRPYRLDPAVALRPEPFGALAYHYDSRRLTFLRDPVLVDVVRALGDHPSPDEAVTAMVPEARRRAFLKALANLAESRFIHADPADEPATGEPDAHR